MLSVGWLRWYGTSKLPYCMSSHKSIKPWQTKTIELIITLEPDGQDEVKMPHLSPLAAKWKSHAIRDIVFSRLVVRVMLLLRPSPLAMSVVLPARNTIVIIAHG